MTSLDLAVRGLQERVAAAHAHGETLCIRGGGSKHFYAPHMAGNLLDTHVLQGVVSYEPSELVVTVAAGTSLAALESTLAESGQYLPFEPPHFARGGRATVGGMVACGLAGPARASVGGVRDYVLGVRLINGLAQHLTFGGQVMKNVAGYDVSRLMVGSLGSLGVLTEVSLKVLPMALADATLQFSLDQHAALEQLHRWCGQPLPLNASCWHLDPALGPILQVRLRGARAAVEAACKKMLADSAGVQMDPAAAANLWDGCRNQTLAFFRLPADQGRALWRLSLPQTAPVLEGTHAALVEWHGALRWVWAGPDDAVRLQDLARSVGGSAAPFVIASAGPAAALRLRHQDAAQMAVAQRLKASFDPQGLFNPDLTNHAN